MTDRTWIVENKWRCSSCGSENLGRHMECQNCRNPKDSGEADDAPDASAPAVSDPELLRLATQGANWVCEFCGGQVRNEHGRCVKNCGAPRAEPPVDPELTARAARAAREESVPPEVSSPPRSRHSRPPPTTVPGPGRTYPDRNKPLFPTRTWFIIAGVVGGLGSLIGLITFLVMPWEVDARVTSIAWVFTSDLHQKTLEHAEGWGHRSDAFNVSCNQKLKTHRDCNPHQCNPYSESYECNCSSHSCDCTTTCRNNKNGFSTCSEHCGTCRSCDTCTRTAYRTCYERCPVYDDWCTYDYYDWPITRTLTTTGNAHDEHWPDLEASGPDQRVDKRSGFTVEFADAKHVSDPWSYSPSDMLEFKLFDSNARWHIEVNRLGHVTPLHRVSE